MARNQITFKVSDLEMLINKMSELYNLFNKKNNGKKQTDI